MLERKSFRSSRYFRDNEIYRWLDSVDVRESSSGAVSGTSNGVTVSTGGDDRVPSLFSCNFYDSLLPLPFLRLSPRRPIDINRFPPRACREGRCAENYARDRMEIFFFFFKGNLKLRYV